MRRSIIILASVLGLVAIIFYLSEMVEPDLQTAVEILDNDAFTQ